MAINIMEAFQQEPPQLDFIEISRPKATHLLGASNKTQGIGHEK